MSGGSALTLSVHPPVASRSDPASAPRARDRTGAWLEGPNGDREMKAEWVYGGLQTSVGHGRPPQRPRSGMLEFRPPLFGVGFQVYLPPPQGLLLKLRYHSIYLPDTFRSRIKPCNLAYGLGLIRFSIYL